MPPIPRKIDVAAPTSWLAVAVIVASGTVGAVQIGKAAIAIPQLLGEFGLGLAGTGWIVAVFSFIGVFGGIPAGLAIGRFGDRRLMIAGLLAMAAGSLAGAGAGSYVALLLFRVVEGFGYLLVIVAAPATMARIVAPPDRDVSFGIWGSYMPVGTALAMLAAPMLPGWRAAWVASGLLALVMAAVVAAVLPPAPRPEPPRIGGVSPRTLARDVAAVFRLDGPLLPAAIFMLYSLQWSMVFSFLPTLLVARMSMSAAAAGALSGVAVSANIVGNVCSGLLLRRGVPRWVLVAVGSLAMGVSGAGILSAMLPQEAVLALAVVFAGLAGLLPGTLLGSAPILAASTRLAPIAIGLVTQGSSLGMVIGPVAAGSVVDAFGWSAAALLTAGVAAAAIGSSLALRRAFLHRPSRP